MNVCINHSYLIKNKGKQKQLLPFYITNNELKKFCINNIKMESKDELKETDIKNCRSYYFDDIMRAWDIDIDTDFSGILLEEKLYKEKNPKYFNL